MHLLRDDYGGWVQGTVSLSAYVPIVYERAYVPISLSAFVKMHLSHVQYEAAIPL
jgi:hypothetical protein